MVEVLMDGSVHSFKSLNLAVHWLKDESLLLSEKSFFLFFERSDTEITDVSGHIHAVPVFVKWHDTGEIGKWHAVGVLGW